MTGTGFMDLPSENQIKIIQLAIPPMVLPEHLTMSGSMTVGNERNATHAIMATCRKLRSLLLKARPLTGHNSTGQAFTFDVERDSLLVIRMNIPANLKTPQIPNLHGRAFLRSPHPWAINVKQHNPLDTSYEESLPFETDFPIAQEIGSLQEMVVVVQTAPGWYISSFQQFGPQPEHRRADPVLGDLNHPVHHTGLRWTNPQLDDDLYSEEVPMIGLHGYSKTRRDWRNPRSQEYSQGGQWAGFRVYLESQEVEFRPLTWDEVEPIVHRQKQPETGRKLLGDKDPEFVSRVKDYDVQTDEPWVKQLATTWKMVRATLHRPGMAPANYDIGLN
ncbi:uncharacterized protein FPRO_16068 [Fusarium proliferatum ET1]|uniref:Uncharacterized protein n=1 Tax=Fusarium proliferatum (strain ET1) TaxID=1227346 RepID=A0A1L7WB92_FUSPR|nr:uncharacterized protein FPRO_16068 [Fusarium proliferatum ET1]CZR49861.1 uncharacterized protein FPRO_16068 [Fusarium proliferatum ET1]